MWMFYLSIFALISMINKPTARVFCRFGFEENVFRTLTKIVIDKCNQFVCFDFFHCPLHRYERGFAGVCNFIKDALLHTFLMLDHKVLKRNLLRELQHSLGVPFPLLCHTVQVLYFEIDARKWLPSVTGRCSNCR